jgi:PAS domain S-box-containing protein
MDPRHLKVLAIDDDRDNLTALKAVLVDALPGCTVVTAVSAAAGLELARAEDPDVILLDVVMPGMDGIEICRVLKADERLRATPVLFLTAPRSDRESRLKALEAGAEGFLSKPWEESELIAQIRAMAKIKLANRLLRSEREELSAQVGERTRALERELAERWRAEEALRESEVRYRALFENSPDAILLTVPDGRVLSANPAACRMFGRTEEEICSLGRAGLTDEGDPRLLELLEQRARTGRASGELTFNRKNGSTFPGELSSVVFRDPSGALRTSMIIHDITERKRAEEILRRSERSLAEAERIGHTGSWEYDVASDTAAWSENMFRIFDVDPATPRELVFRSFVANLVHPDDRARVLAVFQDALAGRGAYDLEYRVVKRDGSVRDIHALAETERDARGSAVRMIGVVEDITERKRAAAERLRLEDQLRQSQKVEAIGRLAGGVAHDFNNLTAIVLGYGEMLLDQLAPEDSRRKCAEQIVAAGQRSAALTRQLLAFSRKQVLQPEVLDLNALIGNLEKMLGRLIGEDVELALGLAAHLGRVKADPGQIEQVVTNIVLNARDAMPTGGKLTIETANVELDASYALDHESVVPGTYVALALTDTGCGMDTATMARLFEPFFTTKPRGKGTGLGLATVYGIVKQSGGYIYAYSEPGRGTTVKIYLPRFDGEADAKPAEHGATTPQGRGERVLLVEDEVSLLQLCETTLAGLGYRVAAAASGAEARFLVEERGFEPDLVVTDVIMPGMSGAELVERLRRNRPGIKALFMSGYPDDAIARHGVLESGTPFIQKPFTARSLALMVRQALAGNPARGGAGVRRVLMIDDDEQYRDLVRSFCTRRGHIFAGVDSAAAALAALAGQPFDVLLLDVNIPGTTGERILREIRAAGHATPAVVLTGDVASANLDALRPLGVLRAVEKSSRPEELLLAIAEATAPTPPAQRAGSEG